MRLTLGISAVALLGGCGLQVDPNYRYVPLADSAPTVIYAQPAASYSVPVYGGPKTQTFDPGYVRTPQRTWNDTPYAPTVAPVMRGQPVGTVNPMVPPIAR